MNRTEVVTAIARRLDMPEQDVRRVLEAFIDFVTDALVDGRSLVFRNFGKFEPRDRAPLRRTNPKTGGLIDVPARRSAAFAPSPNLKRRLNADRRGR